MRQLSWRHILKWRWAVEKSSCGKERCRLRLGQGRLQNCNYLGEKKIGWDQLWTSSGLETLPLISSSWTISLLYRQGWDSAWQCFLVLVWISCVSSLCSSNKAWKLLLFRKCVQLLAILIKRHAVGVTDKDRLVWVTRRLTCVYKNSPIKVLFK